MDPAIVAFGLGVGVLVGMTGIGGGSLMTPLLILVFGIKPITAVGTDLAYGAITKTVGGWRHLRQGTVDMSLSLWMAVGSVPAAIGGVYVLELIERAYGDDFDSILIVALAVTLLFTGTVTMARALFLKALHDKERDTVEMTTRNKVYAIVLGVAVGFVLGVTSAGSGALIAVGLILLFRLVPSRVVGTDIFHAAILLWAAAAAHIVAGNVDFALAGNILIGSIPGVWIGSNLTLRVGNSVLRRTLGLVLIGAGLALLSKAGAGIPSWLIALFPAAIAAMVANVLMRERRDRLRAEAEAAAETPPPVTAADAPAET
ncbi:MAG TPA: sulfite exporter TauE/SafE family protein [Thermoleophilaceae bacterium]|nr:sulfite exporter TauE/SafE family protein [Thermoleophilaceae bacterium]